MMVPWKATLTRLSVPHQLPKKPCVVLVCQIGLRRLTKQNSDGLAKLLAAQTDDGPEKCWSGLQLAPGKEADLSCGGQTG